VIPVYLLAIWLAGRKLKRWHYAVGAGFILFIILFGQNIVREIIFYFYPYYRDSAFDNGQISYANIAKCAAVLILCVLCFKKSLNIDCRANRFYFFLNVAGLMAYCCGSFIPEVSRVGYYMIASQVFLLPNVIKDIECKWFRRLCYMGVTLAFTGYFALLIKGMYAVDVRLLPYLNWIFN
jgi:hypothetical protein